MMLIQLTFVKQNISLKITYHVIYVTQGHGEDKLKKIMFRFIQQVIVLLCVIY